MEINEKKNAISAMMEASMGKIREMVDSNTVTRMLPVGTPAITTVDRIVEMVPQVMDRVEGFIDKKREKADF